MHIKPQDAERIFKTGGVYVLVWLGCIGVAWLIAPKLLGGKLITAAMGNASRAVAGAHALAYFGYSYARDRLKGEDNGKNDSKGKNGSTERVVPK